MDLKAGQRLHSTVCDTSVVVVKGATGVDLTCGGAPLSDSAGGVAGAPASGHDEGSLLGKRYEDATTGIEVLCVKPGAGSIAVDGRLLTLKAAKALPSSD
ncbi:hypothetical protein [Nocardioides marmoribigeumensis]|uniref:Uncharacterized protein n=1 Tax=Nocardioides marmoribigeumensis TaxID=433649 RepID=A0ABU2BXW1_9ACTN|nr:hypothetical protein [Nocardioides marmoribigeumensis]MDR7363248.1 hypothetical protein [Nocardioides marmoribigeumensis]